MKSKRNDPSQSLASVLAVVDPPAHVRDLRAGNRELRSELERLKREAGRVENYFRELRETTLRPWQPPPAFYKPSAKRTLVRRACELVVHFTDWHYGATQDADEIEGFNVFTPGHAEARLLNLCDDVLNWLEVHRQGYRVDRATILCTGDLISGDIHDELRITNAFPTPVQAVGAARLLAACCSKLSAHVTQLTVEFVVADNHGRLTQKPLAKEEGTCTHNYTVGELTRAYLQQHPNIQVRIYPQYETAVSVCGRQYLLMHGHGIMGWAGFPYYGIERKVAKEALARLHMPARLRFHRVILGHYHAPLQHPWYWIGGSASGTDAYDHKAGRHALPQQVAWYVHPEHGEFDVTNFALRDDGAKTRTLLVKG